MTKEKPPVTRCSQCNSLVPNLGYQKIKIKQANGRTKIQYVKAPKGSQRCDSCHKLFTNSESYAGHFPCGGCI